ncbi:MAG: PEGA domain-containing protein [Betaproteobacteria bacterium]|nr:PEGA domain-containing protein [Betaproteobacteria bacterium]
MRCSGNSALTAWCGAASLVVAGCSGMPSMPNPMALVGGSSALHAEVPVRPAATPLSRAGQPIVLRVADYTDARPNAPSRKIGDIRATVANMHGTELALDQDIPAVLGTAVRSQLSADGFRLVSRAGEAHDFEVGGVVKTLQLNIAERDALAVATEVTVRSGKTGEVLWSGLVTEKSDRFAGVNGNTRASITEYLGEGLAEVAVKTSASIAEGLAKSYPRSVSATAPRNVSAVPGVTVLQAPASRESPAATAGVAAVAERAPGSAAAGHFSVTTSPSRAKVYLDDVYYGLTPLKISLDPGVHRFTFKLDGHKTATEKVSVRPGETTELELKFER